MPDERAIRHEHAEAIKCKAKISRLVVWLHVASAANQLHVKNLAVIGIFQRTDHRSMTASARGLEKISKNVTQINKNLG